MFRTELNQNRKENIMKTRQEVIHAISNVQHPAIAYSLLELGIVKDIDLNENLVTITFAFPFPNIPIAGQLVNSISMPIQSLGFDFKYKIVVMTEEEKIKFMEMETKGWKG